LEFIANSHLIVVASGNSGRRPVNSFAAMSSLCVGASSDAKGTRLANYSSFGGKNTTMDNRGNDVVAYGRNASDHGTSFAAPRVALLGCYCQAVLLQIERLFRWTYGSRIAGVPLVGVGMLDLLEGSNVLQKRVSEHATPFMNLSANLVGAVESLHSKRVGWAARFNGRQLKSLICSFAESKGSGKRGKWGFGFVCEDSALDAISKMSVRDMLSRFVAPNALAQIDARMLEAGQTHVGFFSGPRIA
jgi:hypothetical protein